MRARRRSAGTLFLVVSLLVAAGPVAATDPNVPEVAGTTVIEGTGVVGITMRFPETTTPTEFTPTIESEDATFVFLGMSSHGECDYPDFYLFCLRLESYFVPDFIPNATLFGYTSSPPEIPAGLVDFYIVSDGHVRVTARYPELTGTVEVEATGSIHAGLVPLPRQCPLSGCSVLRMGGAADEAPPDSYRATVAYSTTREDPPRLAWTHHLVTCLYPNKLDTQASADPSDHPHGCDFVREPVDDPYNTGWGLSNVNSFVAGAPFGSLEVRWEFAGGGPVYGGYSAGNSGLPDSWHSGGWFHWLAEGVTCPSGDWRDCSGAA